LIGINFADKYVLFFVGDP